MIEAINSFTTTKWAHDNHKLTIKNECYQDKSDGQIDQINTSPMFILEQIATYNYTDFHPLSNNDI